MGFYEGFEEEAYSDASTTVHYDISELNDLFVRLKASITHASILLRWLFKMNQT